MSIVAQDSAHDVEETDFVIVPNVVVGSATALRRLDRDLLAFVVRMHRRGAHVYAACGGTLVLAEAGLLDGLEATTHWGYVDLLRSEFPDVRTRPERILVQAGEGQRIVSSGGRVLVAGPRPLPRRPPCRH